jgi:hypothetical protein
MSGFNWPFGHRIDWRFDPSRRLCTENIEAERTADGNSLVAECSKREANGKIKPKFTAKELVAMLPICEPTKKTIDEIVLETMRIIDLMDDNANIR